MGKRIMMGMLFCIVLLMGCAGKYPVIYAPDARVAVGESYDADDGVHALDALDGDLTDQVRITGGELNVQKSGRYRIRYAVTNSRGVTAKASRIITVSNQSQAFWRTVIAVSVICSGALLLCILFWVRRGRLRKTDTELPPETC